MLPEATNISEQQRDKNRYVKTIRNNELGENEIMYSFPDPRRCKRYTPSQIVDFLQLRIPGPIESEDIEHDVKDNPNFNRLTQEMKSKGFFKKHKDTEKDVYHDKSYRSYIDSIDSKYHDLAFSKDQNVNEIFRATIGTGTNRNIRRTHEYWLNRHKKEKSEIRTAWKKKCLEPQHKDKTVEEQQSMLSRDLLPFWENCSHHFAELWTVINDEQSPYKKNCIDWFENYKEERKNNFCWPFDKRSDNLSLWEDFLCTVMQSLEDVYKVSTVHDKVLINAFCTWNACDPNRKQKFNLLNHGTAARSKSYSADIVNEWCVKGTSQCYTYKTLRSDTSDGND